MRNLAQTNGRVKRNAAIVALLKISVLSLVEIGARFFLSYQRVQQIGLVVGYQRGHATIPEENIAHAAALLDAHDLPLAHAADMAGVKRKSLQQALQRRGLYQPGPAPGPWQSSDEQFVRSVYKRKGWSAARVARDLGRTRNEVIGKANRMGLSAPSEARP